MTPREAIEQLAAFGDLSVPDMPPVEMNEKEWAATISLPVDRVEQAAAATDGAFHAHVDAVRASDPDATSLGEHLERLTRAIAISEVARAAERVWAELARDEQERCAEKAAREMETIPTVLTAKAWLAIQIEANAREAIRSIGGGDFLMGVAKSGSPALAWLGGYRIVGDVMATPGQAAKILGLRPRWRFGR